MTHLLRVLFLLAPLAAGLPGASAAKTASEAKAKPVKGVAILYTGWVRPFMDGVKGTNTDAIGNILRKAGMQVIVADPANWSNVTERFLKSPQRNLPVSLLGYSMGTAAAQSTAMRLQSEGMAVKSMVLIDGRGMLPITSNVEKVTNFFMYGTKIRPGPNFSGTLKNIAIRTLPIKGIATAGHIGMMRNPALRDTIAAALLH